MIRVRLRGKLPAPRTAYDQALVLGQLVVRHHRLPGCDVTVQANRRHVLRWRLSALIPQVSIHWSLLPYPEQVLQVLNKVPGAWESLRTALPSPEDRPVETRPRGRVHDLSALLAAERARLPDPPEPPITWGRWPTRIPRRSLRLGSFANPVVRIHPVLDHESVPDWFVGFVVFHELLHAVFPPLERGGRRQLHPPAFRAAEATHPDYARAHAWERQNVIHLLDRCRAVIAARRRSPA